MPLRSPILPLALAGLMALVAGAAHAAPDITGTWALNQPEGRTRQAPPPLTPAARADQELRAKVNAANNRLIGEAHTKCWPPGMPGLMQPPYGLHFLQTKGRITILSENSTLPRTIYLDETEHTEGFIPGWNGHSIGKWDGNVLVVDTIGLNGRTPRVSTEMHITERIFLEEGGKYLVDELTLNDPVNYTEPYKVRYRYKKAEGREATEYMEYACEVDLANLLAFEAEQKAAGLPSNYDPSWQASGFSNPAPVASK